MSEDYLSSKIYLVMNTVDGKKYVGGTTKNLKTILPALKNDSQTELASQIKELGDDKFTIEIVEDYPCKNEEQLQKRVTDWITLYKTNKKEQGYNC